MKNILDNAFVKYYSQQFEESNVTISEIEMCLFAYAEEIAKNSFKK